MIVKINHTLFLQVCRSKKATENRQMGSFYLIAVQSGTANCLVDISHLQVCRPMYEGISKN